MVFLDLGSPPPRLREDRDGSPTENIFIRNLAETIWVWPG